MEATTAADPQRKAPTLGLFGGPLDPEPTLVLPASAEGVPSLE